MKKRFVFVALAALCVGLFFGCGNDEGQFGDDSSENGDVEKLYGEIVKEKWVNEQNDLLVFVGPDTFIVWYFKSDSAYPDMYECKVKQDSITLHLVKSSFYENDNDRYFCQRKSDEEAWLYGFDNKKVSIFKRIFKRSK